MPELLMSEVFLSAFAAKVSLHFLPRGLSERLLTVHLLPEMGHTAKACTQDETEIDKPSVKCVICQEDGHRARDCTQVRVDRFACRNCK